mmetsp:Transcript_22318/g.38303  ORF Transcript_22318/g.38303 Transcript_22318/m.38303 type:complete len:243 (-) Transcript_22318:124-852(-)
MRHVTLLDIVRFAHIPPILHVQANNRLPIILHLRIILHRPDMRPRLTPVLLRLLQTPALYPRIPLLDQKAVMKHILHRLRKRLGIEETVHRIHLGILLDEFLRPLPHLLLVLDGLGKLGFVLLGLVDGPFAQLPRSIVEGFANDLDVLLHRAQFVSVALLLLSVLVDVLRLFLLLVVALRLLLLLAPLGLFAFFGGVFGIEGTVEEGDVCGQCAEADSHLKAEAVPVELSGRSRADGALFDE